MPTLLKVVASDTVTLDGTISANGNIGEHYSDGGSQRGAAGGGAGGSIQIWGYNVKGSGTVTASGGQGGDGYSSGGAYYSMNGGGGAGGKGVDPIPIFRYLPPIFSLYGFQISQLA